MNKRHYEHTLPNIRGSLSNTYDDKCRGEDCFSVFQDVLVHKLFLFFAVKRVDGPLSGG